MFEDLLKENNSLTLNQEKWFRNLINSSITVKSDTDYNLKATSNKRIPVYTDGLLVSTTNKKNKIINCQPLTQSNRILYCNQQL